MSEKTYFDFACEVLNMAPEELKKRTDIEHTEADKMICDEWNAINPQTEQEIIDVYTRHPGFTLFYIRLYGKFSQYREYQDVGSLQMLEKYIPDVKNKKILEYGAGVCLRPLGLFNLGCKHITLADIPTPMFEIARRAFGSYIGEDQFLKITEKYPLKDKYDVIFCTDVLEHVRDPDKVLKHLSEHTEYLYMTTFFGGSDYAPPHLQENSKYASNFETWIEVIKSCGLKPIYLENAINGLYKSTLQ